MTASVRVTLRDIAIKFGCSRSTVSLAMSDHPRIRPEVRRRIRELAEKMGYRPDPTLTMLASNRFAAQTPAYRATLAYLVDTREAVPSRLYLQRRYLGPAKRRAELRGYQLSEFDLADYPSGQIASNVLYNRGVQGLIIPQMARSAEPMLRASGWNRFTAVSCMLGWVSTPFHVIRKDIFNDMRLLWREAVARGYKRIGGALFQHDPIAEDDYARYGASIAEQRQLIPESQRLPFLLCGPEDKEAFLEWVRRVEPDAIISFIETPREWLKSVGYRIPEDIAFACALVEPTFAHCAGVAALNDEVAYAAVDFLATQIHQNQRGIPEIQQTLLLEPQWNEGVTMPHVNALVAAK
ncbi:MAG: LacI family DNA-binding transcriptional regulator [Magnetospirillum sp.]|nr:LacI family DNA-binding transcriptional regulator [Magnetospirillum sp.]